MNRLPSYLKVIIVLVLWLMPLCSLSASNLDYRWFFYSDGFSSDSDVDVFENVAKKAALSGYNGVVVSAGLDRLDIQSIDYLVRLKRIKSICDRYQLELVPCIFSVGYASSLLKHDHNLAAGFPVKGIICNVTDSTISPDLSKNDVLEINEGFEEHKDNKLQGYMFNDNPGVVTVIDNEVYYSGKASLRFQEFYKNKNSNARVCKKISLKPFKSYKFSCWVKGTGLDPSKGISFKIYSPDNDYIFSKSIRSVGSEWTRVDFNFSSLEYESIYLYIGVWNQKHGTFWLDDISITEDVAFEDVLRREGTPLSVKDIRTRRELYRGSDFNVVFVNGSNSLSLQATHKFNASNVSVDFYRSYSMDNGQISACMTEAKVYAIWRKQIEYIEEIVRPRFYFLSMDEIRQGGYCAGCRSKSKNMSAILGGCVSLQYEIIKNQNPRAKIFIWSDMFDPNVNAKNNKFHMTSSVFYNSWEYLPKDIVPVVWTYKTRQDSVDHFISNGFDVVVAGFYDDKSLEAVSEWKSLIESRDRIQGFMYTTWNDDYGWISRIGNVIFE